jgi:hypothetical protein
MHDVVATPADVPQLRKFKRLHCQTTLKRSIEQKGKSNAVTNPKSTSDSSIGGKWLEFLTQIALGALPLLALGRD